MDIHYSDAGVGCAFSTVNVMGLTVIIAKLVLAGQSVQQIVCAGHSL